jgi:hypothetical protein
MYLMQVACEVRRVLAKHPNSIRPEHFLLKFSGKGERKNSNSNLTREQATAIARARWFKATGKPKSFRKPETGPPKPHNLKE